MNNQEIIEKLDGYCEWCKAQGGHCQAYLDGCSIFDIITELEQQPAAGEFTKNIKQRLARMEKADMDGDKKWMWDTLSKLCERFEQQPEPTEVSKSYGRVLDAVVVAFATTDDEIIQQKVQAAVDQGRKVCSELDRQAASLEELVEITHRLKEIIFQELAKNRLLEAENKRLMKASKEARKHLAVINLDYSNMGGRVEIISSIKKAKEILNQT